jgi:hypothetical protein
MMGHDILLIVFGALAPGIVTLVTVIVNRGTGLSKKVEENRKAAAALVEEAEKAWHDALEKERQATAETDRRLSKRQDRVDGILPTIARGTWAILKFHVQENKGSTDPDIISAYEELTKQVTNGIVSRKEAVPRQD